MGKDNQTMDSSRTHSLQTWRKQLRLVVVVVKHLLPPQDISSLRGTLVIIFRQKDAEGSEYNFRERQLLLVLDHVLSQNWQIMKISSRILPKEARVLAGIQDCFFVPSSIGPSNTVVVGFSFWPDETIRRLQITARTVHQPHSTKASSSTPDKSCFVP